MSQKKTSIKCEICGRTPCFPWANAHDEDFQKEIDEYERSKCHECGEDVYHELGCSQYEKESRK